MKPGVGATFGRWTMLEKVEDIKPAVWKCRCACGTTRAVRQAAMTSGQSRSCGCITREVHQKLSGYTEVRPK